ncbi:uncharacterized protein METZ01_LOCUS483444, partial [marine metagenome]
IFLEKTMGAYFVIGLIAASIDILVFIFLHEYLLLPALICHSISIPISAVFSFICNAFLNFKKTDFLFYRFLSFLIIVATGYLLGAVIILIAESLNFGGTMGKLISLPFVFFLQYFLNSRISFRG